MEDAVFEDVTECKDNILRHGQGYYIRTSYYERLALNKRHNPAQEPDPFFQWCIQCPKNVIEELPTYVPDSVSDKDTQKVVEEPNSFNSNSGKSEYVSSKNKRQQKSSFPILVIGTALTLFCSLYCFTNIRTLNVKMKEDIQIRKQGFVCMKVVIALTVIIAVLCFINESAAKTSTTTL